MARRLLLILLIPLLGFGAFVARVYMDGRDERDRQDEAQVVLAVALDVGAVIDALEAEAQLVELADDGETAAAATDDALIAVQASAARASRLLPTAAEEAIDDAVAAIDQALATRSESAADQPRRGHYLAAIDAFDLVLVELGGVAVLADVTAPLLAHRSLLEARTAALTEHVLVAHVLTGDEWTPGQRDDVVAAARDQQLSLRLIGRLPVSIPDDALIPPARLTEIRAGVARQGQSALADVAADEWLALGDSWREQLDQMADAQIEAATASVDGERSAASASIRSTVLLGVLVMLASATAALTGTILHDRRVLRLKRHMVEVADGNLDLEPIADPRRDEIGAIADAFDDLTDAVRRSVAAEAAEADILEQIARGGELQTVLTMIADLATAQTGVEHRIVTDDPETNGAEPIRMSEADQPVAWLVRVGAEPLTGPRPAVVGSCLGLALLALERDRTDQTLTYQATHDVLTGLANRAVLLREAERALHRAGPGRAAVLYCDLDGFKAINDGHGHRAGDRLLVEAATRLRSVIGTSGLLARVGGDEFVALLPDISAVESVTRMADEILDLIAAPFQQGPASMFVSVSVGIAVATPGTNAEDLVRNADLALYRAKAGGRARWELFDEELGEWAERRVETANALREALDEDQIELWYQPVFGIAGGLVGFEGLVRWNRPGYGIVSPADFLSVAEETGMIIPLGDRVLSEGCRQLSKWAAATPEVPTVLSLNMSGAQLTNAEFAGRVGAALRHADAPANRLQVEITETVLLENRVEAASTLAELRRMGVRIAIDDFGTGYSSLAFLRELPVDLLKIDRAFVHVIEESAEDQAIVQAVISLADALNMVVIAEGVERPEQLRELKRLGCRYVQGFLMGRPMTAFAATKLLEDQLAADVASAAGASTRS